MTRHWRQISVMTFLSGLISGGLIAGGMLVARGDQPETKTLPVTALVREAGTDRPVPRFTIAVTETNEQFKPGVFVSNESGELTLERKANTDPKALPACVAVPFRDERWQISRPADDKDWRDLKFLERAGTAVAAAWEQRAGQPLLVIDASPVGEWEAIVRGPDGRPVADSEVDVFTHGSFRGLIGYDSLRFRGRTDAAGRIQLRWPVEQRMFMVRIPGLGVALSVPINVLAQKTVTTTLPLLARFGRITGRVHPEVARAGDSIKVESNSWDRSLAVIQKDGQFDLRDVVPGDWSLRILSRQPMAAYIRVQATISVGPGQHVRAVDVEVPAVLPEAPRSLPARPTIKAKLADVRLDGQGNAKAFVTGRVTDPAGEPLEGVQVIVTSQYYGGLRMYESTSETQTAKDGTYRVAGVQLGTGSVGVVAFPEGRPTASVRGTAVGLPGDGSSRARCCCPMGTLRPSVRECCNSRATRFSRSREQGPMHSVDLRQPG